MAEKPYRDLSTQGRHRGDKEGLESGMSVRAPQPPDRKQATSEASQQPGPTHQVLFNEGKGLYRVRLWNTEDVGTPPEAFEELGRYPAEEFSSAHEHFPDQPYYVVLENTESGEVFLAGSEIISDNWSQEGQFDQFTVFENEPDAAAYADRRQKNR